MAGKSSDSAGEVVGQLAVFVAQVSWLAGKWFFRGLFLFARVVARGSAQVAPAAQTQGGATGTALLFGGVWPLVGLIIGAIFGGGGGAVVGLVCGGFVGCVVGYGVFSHGRAEAAVAAGAISVGQDHGPFGVVQAHVIARATRLRHVAVYGATGAGKSTALTNLVMQDALAPGRPGILVVDLKDDLALQIARQLPSERLSDVLLFDPADREYPPAFNPFAGVAAEGRTLAAAELVSAFKRLYAEAWGPRLEHVLRAAVQTLLETPEATLLDIARLLTDPDYRSWAVSQVTNFSVHEFWEREWVAIVGKNGSLANVESILNKLSIFSYPEIRNVVGQTKRGLDMRQAMDAGQIVLANLPQGALGEDASSFLAALLVGKTQLAAQSRVQLARGQRKPFYVFADEFQNYQTSAFDKLVTEGRSMGVGLVAACQYPEQLPAQLRLTLEKNCAYALHCRQREGTHTITVVKLQEPEAPDAQTLLKAAPPWHAGADAQLATIRTQSRRTLGAARSTVEAAIARRLRGSSTASITTRPVATTGLNGAHPARNGTGPSTRRIVPADEDG